jgi:hypothetical protein
VIVFSYTILRFGLCVCGRHIEMLGTDKNKHINFKLNLKCFQLFGIFKYPVLHIIKVSERERACINV